jgi:hypothetical protein
MAGAAGVAAADSAAAVAAVAGAAAAVVVAAVAAAGGDKEDRAMPTTITSILRRATLVAAALLIPVRAAAADAPAQKKFAKPEEAVRALVAAARSDDKAAMAAILGPESEEILSSGDPVDDKAAAQRFLTGAAEGTRLETLDSGAVIVHIGKDDWPFPIPLVKDGDEFRFDTPAGKEELLNRRIGRNELKAIDVAHVYVDAQREYASRERVPGSGRTFAQKVRSEPGKQDGLYWDDPTGKQPSPLGPFVAEAESGGYETPEAGAAPRPFHGYYYKILTAQGPHAPGGARSYLKDGKMTGGFAMLAYPAEHGSSGVMTFMVGSQGIVYQKNLGDKTADVAKAMTTFDPDDSWTPIRD